MQGWHQYLHNHECLFSCSVAFQKSLKWSERELESWNLKRQWKTGKLCQTQLTFGKSKITQSAVPTAKPLRWVRAENLSYVCFFSVRHSGLSKQQVLLIFKRSNNTHPIGKNGNCTPDPQASQSSQVISVISGRFQWFDSGKILRI